MPTLKVVPRDHQRLKGIEKPAVVFVANNGDGAMPRYFFRSLNGHTDHDIEGTELPDDNAARAQAMIYAAELLRRDPMRVWDGGALRVEVRNATAGVVFRIAIKAEEH